MWLRLRASGLELGAWGLAGNIGEFMIRIDFAFWWCGGENVIPEFYQGALVSSIAQASILKKRVHGRFGTGYVKELNGVTVTRVTSHVPLPRSI